MKRTVDANLNGIHFVIDEDAYNLLEQYLKELEQHFSKEEEKDVVTDIEARIAELFSESLIHGRNVVDIEITQHALDLIGRPEQMDEDNGESYDRESSQYNKSEKTGEDSKTNDARGDDLLKKLTKVKLYRDTDDVMVAGVCSGIALRLKVEAWLIRLAVALGTIFTNGIVLLTYIVMWILIPKAISVAQKLEMRGQEADVSSIQNFKSEPVQKTDAQNIFGSIIKFGIVLIICAYLFAGCNLLHMNLFLWSPFHAFIEGILNKYNFNVWYAVAGLCFAVSMLLPLTVAVVWLFKKIFNNPYKPFGSATKTTLWLVWIIAVIIFIIARIKMN